MWDDILRKVRAQRLLSVFCFVLELLCGFFVMISIPTLWYLLMDYNKERLPLYLFCFIPAISLLILVFIIRFYIKKRIKDDGPDPYVVIIDPMSFEELITRLSTIVKLNEIDGGWYSWEHSWAGLNNMLCIYSYSELYEKSVFRTLQQNLKDRARRACGLKQKMSLAKANAIVNININTFSIADGNLLDSIRASAASGTRLPISTMDLYIDLSTGYIYIPKYRNLRYGNMKVYSESIRYISEILRYLQ